LQLSAGHAQIKNQIQEGQLKISTDLKDDKNLMKVKVEATVTLEDKQDMLRKEAAQVSEPKQQIVDTAKEDFEKMAEKRLEYSTKFR
jgi:hypothetical protein